MKLSAEENKYGCERSTHEEGEGHPEPLQDQPSSTWITEPSDWTDFQQSKWNRSTFWLTSQIARFMGPTWGPPRSYRSHMSPMLAPWTMLSVISFTSRQGYINRIHFNEAPHLVGVPSLDDDIWLDAGCIYFSWTIPNLLQIQRSGKPKPVPYPSHITFILTSYQN